VEALSECLEKFTNLMASVSQSALIMQQSVAAMSHQQQQWQHQSVAMRNILDQSMNTMSMNRILPNQPLYTSSFTVPSFGSTLNLNTKQQQQPPQQRPQLQPGGSHSANDHNNDNDQSNDKQSEVEPNSNSKSPTMSMLEVINQLSNTQGGPNGAELPLNSIPVQGQRSGTNVIAGVHNLNGLNVMSSPVAAEQQQLIQQQQQLLALQQQALQLRALQYQQQPQSQQQAVGAKATHFVNANYPKPVLFGTGNTKTERNGVSSSPILHSTHHSSPSMQHQQLQQQQQQQPVLNMLNERPAMNSNLSGSGCSGTVNEQQPGTQSKSKIFEHKKALRNVSPEMDLKLKELNAMGYTNRTFNLVLLKQENGDLPKVIENLKQFYSNNQ